jgi:hypothetical protein
MNLSTLYRPFELAGAWPRSAHPQPAQQAGGGLSELQRRLVMLHVAQATPTRASDTRPSWPGVAIAGSAMAALFIFAAGGWQ